MPITQYRLLKITADNRSDLMRNMNKKEANELPKTKPHSKTPETENATRKRRKMNMM